MWRKSLAVMTAAVLLMGSVPVTAHAAGQESGTPAGEVDGWENYANANEDGNAENIAVPTTEDALEIRDTVSGNEVLDGDVEMATEPPALYMEGQNDSVTTIQSVSTEGTYCPYEEAKYSLTYSVEEDGITITGITDYESKETNLGELVIPEEIDGITVTEIGYGAFDSCSGFVGKLNIPKGVKLISAGAFWGCSGFVGDLIIPEGVGTIGNSAFYGCSGFNGILSIPKGVTTIANGAFCNCSGFTGDLVIPEGVDLIGYKVFEGCSGFNGKLVIPEGATIIGERSFYGCSGFTGSLIIPKGVTIIDAVAFRDCSGFNGSLIIPEGVTSIGNSAFKDCSGFIGNLVIPEGVTTIGGSAFNGCSGFNGSLVLPDSLTTIYSAAFSNCSGFTGNLVIPKGIKTIEDYAFENCRGFTGDLVIPEGMTQISGGVFKDCSNFNGKLVIPEGITIIGGSAFESCSGFIGKLDIPDSVKTIGKYAFSNCKGFTGDLEIPKGVTTISDCAFMDCKGFTGQLIIPEGVTKISDYVFNGCSGFVGSLKIPEGVTEIGEYAFWNCNGLTGHIVIPEGVTAIRKGAFACCNGLDSVTVLGAETYISHGGNGALGPIKIIYGYRGSIAENYADTADDSVNHTFIPLVKEPIENFLQITTSGLNTAVSTSMTQGEKLTLLSAVLAERGLTDIAEGTSLEVTVSKISPQNTDKQAMDACAKSKGMTVAQYLSISMNLHSDSIIQAVTQTDIPVRLAIEVPPEIQQKDRRFAVVRLHDGGTEVLEDLDDNALTVTIETDCFSSYALVYRDSGGAGSIAGKVTCFGSTDTATVFALKAADGVEDAHTTVIGKHTAYILKGIADGTYRLQASRAGHTTREYIVTVTDGQATQDVELWLTGDVDGSGSINAKDKKMLFEHMSGTPLTGYAFLVGDVDNSGSINAKDKKMLFNHMEGTEKLW